MSDGPTQTDKFKILFDFKAAVVKSCKFKPVALHGTTFSKYQGRSIHSENLVMTISKLSVGIQLLTCRFSLWGQSFFVVDNPFEPGKDVANIEAAQWVKATDLAVDVSSRSIYVVWTVGPCMYTYYIVVCTYVYNYIYNWFMQCIVNICSSQMSKPQSII